MGDHYKIISAISRHALEEMVEDLWKDGWRPCGGPVFVRDEPSTTPRGTWYQGLMFGVVDTHSFAYSTSNIISVLPDVTPVTPPKTPEKQG